VATEVRTDDDGRGRRWARTGRPGENENKRVGHVRRPVRAFRIDLIIESKTRADHARGFDWRLQPVDKTALPPAWRGSLTNSGFVASRCPRGWIRRRQRTATKNESADGLEVIEAQDKVLRRDDIGHSALVSRHFLSPRLETPPLRRPSRHAGQSPCVALVQRQMAVVDLQRQQRQAGLVQPAAGFGGEAAVGGPTAAGGADGRVLRLD
jgi:hypothetical protein